MDQTKEKRVYVLECDGNFDFREAERLENYESIMVEAEKRGTVYSLEFFTDEINSENLNLSNSFIYIN